MKKFIISNSKGTTSVMEVECEKVSIFEDGVVALLKDGEWKARIDLPISLYEKFPNGKVVKPIFCWHAFYETVDLALEEVGKGLYWEILRAKKKELATNPDTVLEVSKEEIDELLSKVKVKNL